MTGAAGRAIAGCFALAAFAVAVLAGLAGGNDTASILIRAIVCMIVCYPVGMLVGLVCQHVIRQDAEQTAGENADAPAQSAGSAEEAEDVLVV